MVKLVFLASSSAIDDDGESDLAHHRFWSHVFVAVGFSWVVGSVLFFPTLGIDFENSGAVIFLVSSLIAALGSLFGMRIIRRKMSELELQPIEHDHDDHLNYLNGHEDDGSKPHVGQNLDYHLMGSQVSNSGKDVEVLLLSKHIKHDGHAKMALRGTSMLYKRLIYKVRMVNVIGFFYWRNAVCNRICAFLTTTPSRRFPRRFCGLLVIHRWHLCVFGIDADGAGSCNRAVAYF